MRNRINRMKTYIEPEQTPSAKLIFMGLRFVSVKVLNRYESSKELTDELCKVLSDRKIAYRRGRHWTTDAGYMETWGQIIEYRGKGAQCVEMEGVGLFTVAAYRKRLASAIYVFSDVYDESNWNLGWSEKKLDDSIQMILDAIVSSL